MEENLMAKRKEINPEGETKEAKEEIKELDTLQKELDEEKKIEAKAPNGPKRNCV